MRRNTFLSSGLCSLLPLCSCLRHCLLFHLGSMRSRTSVLSRLHKGEISVISSLAKELPFLPQFLGLLQGLAKENNTHTQEEMSLGYFFQHGCGKRKKEKKKRKKSQCLHSINHIKMSFLGSLNAVPRLTVNCT